MTETRDPMADFENGMRIIAAQPEQALVVSPDMEAAVLKAVEELRSDDFTAKER